MNPNQYIIMKQLFRVKLILLFSFLLVACGDGGTKIEEVKLIPILSGEEYQYIDTNGKIVINPQFSQATVF